MKKEKKIATVIWAREVKLDQFLAQALGSSVIVSCHRKWHGFRLPAFLRYVIQAADTLKRLLREKPDVILVMNPPVVAPLVVWAYSLFHGSEFIIDTHTAGFLDAKWKFFHPLHRFLARKAVLNTVHNEKNLEILERWGIGNGYVLPFYNPAREELPMVDIESLPLPARTALENDRPKILTVNRFASDDAWQETAETARIFPEAVFFITGDPGKIPEKTIRRLPENVILTGYLGHPAFMRLMQECDVVLTLTKRRDTVLWSVREAMAIGKPFVTTDSEVLRNCYGSAGIFASMEPEDIKRKLLEAIENKLPIEEKIAAFLEKDRERWKKDITHIKSVIRKG